MLTGLFLLEDTDLDYVLEEECINDETGNTEEDGLELNESLEEAEGFINFENLLESSLLLNEAFRKGKVKVFDKVKASESIKKYNTKFEKSLKNKNFKIAKAMTPSIKEFLNTKVKAKYATTAVSGCLVMYYIDKKGSVGSNGHIFLLSQDGKVQGTPIIKVR